MHEPLARLKEIFATVLQEPIEKIASDASPKTLRSWDSLRHVELIIEVENSYRVSFSPTEVFTMNTFQGFCDMLCKKGINFYGEA
jgi:acyl carrier protein